VLEHSLVDSITLEEEIVMLTSYLDFERLRHNNAFSFELFNADDLDTEMIYIPPLFIQPFVENAIKHGVKDMNGDGEVSIRFTDCEKYLKVEIVDNGKGVDKQKVSKDKNHKSRSTEIVSKRLKLLRSKYKDLPKFTITNNGINVDNGVTVTLYLPIL